MVRLTKYTTIIFNLTFYHKYQQVTRCFGKIFGFGFLDLHQMVLSQPL